MKMFCPKGMKGRTRAIKAANVVRINNGLDGRDALKNKPLVRSENMRISSVTTEAMNQLV